MKTHLDVPALLAATLSLVFMSCGSLLSRSYTIEEMNESRAVDQTHIEDSAKVFFVEHFNPYPDKEFLWFASFVAGPVELYVHDLETDSVLAIYRFRQQDVPEFTLAMHPQAEKLVKCVIVVNGRKKCARVYHAWVPVPISHWTTQYDVEEF